jgi:hypothetical protein
MVKQNPFDNNYVDGVDYVYSRTFSATGVYEYFFCTQDPYYYVQNTTQYFTVEQTSAPVLEVGKVNPTFGVIHTTNFQFTIYYFDADNDAPTSINVRIDGTNYPMLKVDPMDNNYVDGLQYYYTTTWSKLGVFEYNLQHPTAYILISTGLSILKSFKSTPQP